MGTYTTAQHVGVISMCLFNIAMARENNDTICHFNTILEHLDRGCLDLHSLIRIAQYFLQYADDATFYKFTDWLVVNSHAPS